MCALTDVSFTVCGGEVFGLLGPNGAGKTTTIECLLGLIEPEEGRIEICGADIRIDPRAAKQSLGAALQSTGLQDKITLREALRGFGALYSRRADPGALLDRFRLSEQADARFETLSAGQKQRFALALAFVNDPEVIIMDEPSAALDPHMRREFRSLIQTMKADGRAVLLATHDMEEAEQLCDRIAVIDCGRIVAQGTPRELIAGYGAEQATLEDVILKLTAPAYHAGTQ